MGLKIVVSTDRMKAFDQVLTRFQSSAMLRQAMARGLNEHLQRQKRDSVTTVAAQTGLPRGMVEKAASVRKASSAALTGAVKMQAKPVLAGEMTRKSWNKAMAGAKHGDWPTYTRKGGMMEHTFIAYGKIMRRKPGAKRGPLQAVWGPVIPNEMLREDMPNYKRAEADVQADLANRVARALISSLGF